MPFFGPRVLVVRVPLGAAFFGVDFFGGAFLIVVLTRAFLGGSLFRDSLEESASVMSALGMRRITCLGGVSTLPLLVVEVTTTRSNAGASRIGFLFGGLQ